MKVKLDRCEISILVNGLFRLREKYSAEQRRVIDEVILNLIDITESMKPGRKVKLLFELEEIRLIRRCLIDWRNAFIVSGQSDYSEIVAEILHKVV